MASLELTLKVVLRSLCTHVPANTNMDTHCLEAYHMIHNSQVIDPSLGTDPQRQRPVLCRHCSAVEMSELCQTQDKDGVGNHRVQ